MDELRVSSKLMNRLVSKFVKSKIKKCCGQEVNVGFSQIVASVKDGDKVCVHVELDADMTTADFERLMMKALGLGGEE